MDGNKILCFELIFHRRKRETKFLYKVSISESRIKSSQIENIGVVFVNDMFKNLFREMDNYANNFKVTRLSFIIIEILNSQLASLELFLSKGMYCEQTLHNTTRLFRGDRSLVVINNN